MLADYAYLLSDFDGGLALFTPEGEWLASSNPATDWSARPFTELLSQASAQSEPRFSAVFADPVSGGLMLMVAAVAAADLSATPAPIAVGLFSPTRLARQTLGPELAPDE